MQILKIVQSRLEAFAVRGEAILIMQGQEVISADQPLVIVVVGGMVMPLAVRGRLAAVSHCRDQDDDGRKPSKVRFIWVVQYSLSTGQKTFFSRRNIV